MFNTPAILLLVCLIGVEAGDNTIRLYSIKCFPNEVMLANATCRLRAINRTMTIANMYADFAKTVYNVSLQVAILKRSSVQFRPWIIGGKINICKFLNAKDSFANIPAFFLKVMTEHTNVNKSMRCPYSGYIQGRDLYIDPKYLPVSFPEGKYRLDLKFEEGYPPVLIGLMQLFVDIAEKITKRGKNWFKN